jgi:hypothetical protein
VVRGLIAKHRIAAGPELQKSLDALHPADVASVLEGLPLEDRLLVWGLVRSDRDGEILLEVSDAVRDSLLADMDSAEIVAAAQNLDVDEIADLAPDLPQDVVQDIIEAQDTEERAQLQSALSYPEGTGRRADGLRGGEHSRRRDLRSGPALPAQVRRASRDARRALDRRSRGPAEGDAFAQATPGDRSGRRSRSGLRAWRHFVRSRQRRDEAAEAFDRYDLVSAPVGGPARQGARAVTVDVVLDYVREKQESQELAKAGLREDEDIFSSVWSSAKNRGPGSRSISARVRRFARRRRLRGLESRSWRRSRAHAYRCRNRRQLRQPDDDAHRAIHRPGAGERLERAPAPRPRVRGERVQRRRLGRRASDPHLGPLRQRRPRRRDGARDAPQLMVGALYGLLHPDPHGALRRDPAVESERLSSRSSPTAWASSSSLGLATLFLL